MSDQAHDLDAVELGLYLDLIEVTSVVRHAVDRQLRENGDLSYVQFQILARLGSSPTGGYRMTELADGVVYSRSGLTYQAGVLEQAGLVTRARTPDDDRGMTVTITKTGRERLGRVFPGHLEIVRRLLFDPLSPADVETLAALLAPMREHVRSTPPRSAAPRRGKASRQASRGPDGS
ncbi:MAG TPA: MarR family transcriptional regulator [Solirubrobacteraceae bacterium]